MPPSRKTPKFHSPLTELYYDEARRCLKAKCYIASIALSWAAIDYAIEHELSGGSRVNSKTFLTHPPLTFQPTHLADKLEKLSSLFPELSTKWNPRLTLLYKSFRNTFLHAKLRNITEKPLKGTTLKAIRIELPSTPPDKKHNSLKPRQSISSSPEERLDKETYLIALAESSAASVFEQTTDFLSALNTVISKRAFPPNEGS